MKIAGIAGSKHPTLKKGDIIELSSEDKICVMAKEQVSVNSPEGYKYIPIQALNLNTVQKIEGRKLKGKEDPPQYIGEVMVKYRVLRLSDNRLMPTKSMRVKVHCKDCKNDVGIPDLELIDYKCLDS